MIFGHLIPNFGITAPYLDKDKTMFTGLKKAKHGSSTALLSSCALTCAMLLSACSSNDQEQVNNLNAANSSSVSQSAARYGLDKIQLQAQEEIARTYDKSWTDANEQAYLEVLKQTDITFDEVSGGFVKDSNAATARSNFDNNHQKLYNQKMLELYREQKDDTAKQEALDESKQEQVNSEANKQPDANRINLNKDGTFLSSEPSSRSSLINNSYDITSFTKLSASCAAPLEQIFLVAADLVSNGYHSLKAQFISIAASIVDTVSLQGKMLFSKIASSVAHKLDSWLASFTGLAQEAQLKANSSASFDKDGMSDDSLASKVLKHYQNGGRNYFKDKPYEASKAPKSNDSDDLSADDKSKREANDLNDTVGNSAPYQYRADSYGADKSVGEDFIATGSFTKPYTMQQYEGSNMPNPNAQGYTSPVNQPTQAPTKSRMMEHMAPQSVLTPPGQIFNQPGPQNYHGPVLPPK